VLWCSPRAVATPSGACGGARGCVRLPLAGGSSLVHGESTGGAHRSPCRRRERACASLPLSHTRFAARAQSVAGVRAASMSATEVSRRSVSNKGDDEEKPAAAGGEAGGGEIKLEAKMSLLNGITVIVGSIIGSGE